MGPQNIGQEGGRKGKAAQNRSPDPSRGPSGPIFHPGSIFGGPGARKRPRDAEGKQSRDILNKIWWSGTFRLRHPHDSRF